MAEFRAAAAAEDELKDAAFEMESTRARACRTASSCVGRSRRGKGSTGNSTRLSRRSKAGWLSWRPKRPDTKRSCGQGNGQCRRPRGRCGPPRRPGRPRATRSSEKARREAAILEALSGIEAREAVLEDLVARREGTPAGARDLMARSEGCRLLAEAVEVEAGYERAVAAALGPLAQAVVLGAPDDLRLVLEGDDVLEAIVADGERPPSEARGAAPAGTRDLWELISGPPRVIGALRRLLPATAVVVDDVRLERCRRSREPGTLPAGEPQRGDASERGPCCSPPGGGRGDPSARPQRTAGGGGRTGRSTAGARGGSGCRPRRGDRSGAGGGACPRNARTGRRSSANPRRAPERQRPVQTGGSKRAVSRRLSSAYAKRGRAAWPKR